MIASWLTARMYTHAQHSPWDILSFGDYLNYDEPDSQDPSSAGPDIMEEPALKPDLKSASNPGISSLLVGCYQHPSV